MLEYISKSCRITADEFTRRHWDDGESMSAIARSIGVLPSVLQWHLRRHKIRSRTARESYAQRMITGKSYGRKYTVNQHFFDSWSPAMAWVLGLLAADGSIHPTHRQFYLASKDLSLIHKFYYLLRFNGPVAINNTGCHMGIICSVVLVHRLMDLGLIPNKTLILRYPPVPDNLHRHFIRGYFDADGSIRTSLGSKGITPLLRIKISTSSESFATSLSNILIRQNLKHSLRRRGPEGKRKPHWNLDAGSYNALQFCDFIYHDAPPELRLERKFRIYSDYVLQYGHLYANGPRPGKHSYQSPR